jgi:hypothetical protein
MEFPLGTNKRVHKEIHRKVVRSFFYLLKSTTPEDAGFLEELKKEVNNGTILDSMLELRIIELLMVAREETLKKLKSPHHQAQSPDRLESLWIEIVATFDGRYLRVPPYGTVQSRPIWTSTS